jgi:hypothetical protein
MPKSIESITPPERGKLTWAQQTYYQAKYGIIEADQPEVGLSETRSERKVLGSNDRLQRILAQSRVNVTSCRPNGTLIHTGPDGSAVLTNEIGWGLPNPEPTDLYIELDDRYMCYWEISQATWTPEAPYWATCLDY